MTDSVEAPSGLCYNNPNEFEITSESMKDQLIKKYKRIVLYAEISLFMLLIPILYNFVPINKTDQTIYITSSTIEGVVDALESGGYTVTWFDRLMLQAVEIPQKGWYRITNSRMGRFHFFLYFYAKRSKTIDVVIFAGETARELTKRLANDMNFDPEKLLDTYVRYAAFKEAAIFAGEYTLPWEEDEAFIMTHLLDHSQEELRMYVEENFKKTPSKEVLEALLIKASIIQKESNAVSEMPLIASVIENRLKKNMKLQMDSTLNYGKYSHKIVTPKRIKTDTTRYNTYKYKGLPPHPLSTVTLDALYAAQHPAKTKYLFFMLSPKGGHTFAATYKEHKANIRDFRIYQREKQEAKALAKAKKEESKNQESTKEQPVVIQNVIESQKEKVAATEVKSIEKMIEKAPQSTAIEVNSSTITPNIDERKPAFSKQEHNRTIVTEINQSESNSAH